jgi:hypothetical protein
VKWLFALVFTSSSIAFAEQPWPPKVFDPVFVETKTTSLPAALQKAILAEDEFSQGEESLPDTFAVATPNLNPGHIFFLVESHQSYSGGPTYILFLKKDGQFVQVAYLQGLIYFGPRVDGYNEIVDQGRGGGGQYSKSLSRFRGDRYHLARLTDYQMNEEGGQLTFVRERDPKPYDN